MTRLDAASFVAGSLMFPVEIPGLEDVAMPSTSTRSCSQRTTRPQGRKGDEVSDLNLSLETSPAVMQLLDDVRALKRKGLGPDASSLAQALRGIGYVAERVAQHASHGAPSALRLAHDFVIVRSCGPVPLVVEPSFQEHFGIGSMYATERYRQLLAAVPEELVAPYSRLQEMVQVICREMKWSFEATGNSLPPWRSFGTILSRWSPARTA